MMGTAGLYGPGVFDMKASLAIFMAVIEELKKNWERTHASDLGVVYFGRGDRQPDFARAD